MNNSKLNHTILLSILILFSILFFNFCSEKISEIKGISPPTNLAIIQLNESELELSWINPDIDNLTGVRIGKRIGEQEWNNNYAELPAGINNFIDSLILIPNLIVAYRIQAFSDNDSSDISQACAFFFPETAPSNISGRQIDSENFLLNWSDNSTGEDYFVIDKKTGNNDWQKAYRLVEANQTEFIDKAGSTRDSIYYRISASVGINSSAFSSTIGLKISALSLSNLYFGSESTFEILTWNVQNFPRKNGDTIIRLSQAINALQVDIVALQEVESHSSFNTLIDSLANYQGFRANSAYADLDLAYLYNTNYVTVDSVYEIYNREYSAFPRRPLVLHCRWQNIPMVIINNHYKCCGDGVINRTDDDDEEYRRFRASELLVTYIQNHFANDRVILVGDFNDEITDIQNNNVFQPFIELSSSFKLADMSIALGSSSQWSYPTWPSHLDHIIISDELFDEFSESNTSVQTLLIDQYFSRGWNEYALNISDHRPVGLKFRFTNTVY